jgi:hypothetical protein
MSTTTDGFNIANQGPGTYKSKVALKGGTYALQVVATFGGGNVKLQNMGPDGVTFIDIPNTTLSANGFVIVTIPAGIYQIVVTTATAVYAALQGVPT